MLGDTNKVIPCHICVLYNYSYFRHLLSQKNNYSIKVDVSETEFKIIRTFLYTKQLSPLLSGKNIFSTLLAAKTFQINTLVEQLSSILAHSLTQSNWPFTLNFAQSYSLSLLCQSSLRLAFGFSSSLVQISDQFAEKNLPQHFPIDTFAASLISQDALNVAALRSLGLVRSSTIVLLLDCLSGLEKVNSVHEFENHLIILAISSIMNNVESYKPYLAYLPTDLSYPPVSDVKCVLTGRIGLCYQSPKGPIHSTAAILLNVLAFCIRKSSDLDQFTVDTLEDDISPLGDHESISKVHDRSAIAVPSSQLFDDSSDSSDSDFDL